MLSYYDAVDEFLGDREGRYFGDGYVQTSHELSNFKLYDIGDGFSFECIGRVGIQNVWSQKEGTNQTPHLSTIDVIEFAVICVSKLRERTLRTSEVQCTCIESISITAGKSPVEVGLDCVDISGHLRHLSERRCISDIRIANMDIVVTFSSDTPQQESPVFGAAKVPVFVKNVMVNPDVLAASALAETAENESHNGWPISSCFAALLQVGQTLIYRVDDMSRQESNTLWMKRTRIEITSFVPPASIKQPMFVWLENVRRYTKNDGDWRRADICGIVANMKISCSVTHKLPNRLNGAD